MSDVPVVAAGMEVEPLSSAAPGVFDPSLMSPDEQKRFYELVGARQAEIDGILEKIEDPAKRSAELNAKFKGEWDDEHGLTYLHILGEELPGLEIHNNAIGLVIAACLLDDFNIEGGNLETGVFSMSVINRLKGRGANLNMVVAPFAQIEGDIRNASGIDANFNFGRLAVRAGRADFANGFFIATDGLTKANRQEADFSYATFVGDMPPKERKAAIEILQRGLSGGFLNARTPEDRELFRFAQVYHTIDAAYALEVQRDAEGQIWLGGNLNGARLARFVLTASVVKDVSFRGASAPFMRAAGLTSFDADFTNIKAPKSWLPGGVHINLLLNEAQIPNSHWPGGVLINPQDRAINAEDTNMDGTVVISDSPHHELQEQTAKKGRLKVITPDKLSAPVHALVERAQAIAASTGNKPKELGK